MFCPFCGFKLHSSAASCTICGKNVQFLKDCLQPVAERGDQENTENVALDLSMKRPAEEEKQTSANSKKRKGQQQKRNVKIWVGFMAARGGALNPVRGTLLKLVVPSNINAKGLKDQAAKKMMACKQIPPGPYVLVYPDGTKVNKIPGTEDRFILRDFKEEFGLKYQSVKLYLATTEEYVKSRISAQETSTSEEVETNGGPSELLSDSEPVQDPENEPETLMTPNEYEQLYAPIEDDNFIEEDGSNHAMDENAATKEVSAAAIISNIALEMSSNGFNIFHICRSDFWDGAVRGFMRKSFSMRKDLLIKFYDGHSECEDDRTSSKKEFFALLMKSLSQQPIFDGPENRRYIVYNPTETEEEEYTLAGRMITMAMVHSGFIPTFLSKDLLADISGVSTFTSSISDITDEEIGNVLQEIQDASCLEVLQRLVTQNNNMLENAGCNIEVESVEEKHFIVQKFLKWYIIDRNRVAINRLKEGMDSFKVLSTEKKPTVMPAHLDSSPVALSAMDIQNVFKTDYSEVGSNLRSLEEKMSSFWGNYLLDCEEDNGAVKLHQILMFAIGSRHIPPPGSDSEHRLHFNEHTFLPYADTCTNTLNLPIVDDYNIFKQNMNYAIKESLWENSFEGI